MGYKSKLCQVLAEEWQALAAHAKPSRTSSAGMLIWILGPQIPQLLQTLDDKPQAQEALLSILRHIIAAYDEAPHN